MLILLIYTTNIQKVYSHEPFPYLSIIDEDWELDWLNIDKGLRLISEFNDDIDYSSNLKLGFKLNEILSIQVESINDEFSKISLVNELNNKKKILGFYDEVNGNFGIGFLYMIKDKPSFYLGYRYGENKEKIKDERYSKNWNIFEIIIRPYTNRRFSTSFGMEYGKYNNNPRIDYREAELMFAYKVFPKIKINYRDEYKRASENGATAWVLNDLEYQIRGKNKIMATFVNHWGKLKAIGLFWEF